MRVEEAKVNVERSGEFKETTFRIKASAKAFSILSSQIYTDVILAVVRELSTNCWDAHIAAGTTNRPFKVHLPNNLEPHFSIRDYGTGLSPKDIEHLYTTYFESNKTESNDFTGCLGIGSKSPFAYTDSFQVISYFDGKKHTYNCFKGEEGFPKVALMDTQNTDEDNGLEIIIAVKKNDFRTFAHKAQQLYKYFPLTPEVIGNTEEYNIVREEPIYEGTCWKFMSKDKYQSIAVMGNVVYPMNRYMLDSDVVDIPLNNKFIVQFNIGELEIAANREELQWNEKTIEAINSKLRIVKKELTEQVQNKFIDCKTLWEARVMACKILNYDGDLYNLKFIFKNGDELKWRGKVLHTGVKVNHLGTEGAYISLLKLKQQRSKTVCSREENIYSIGASKNVKFMVDNLKKAGLARSRSWLKEQEDTNIYLYYIKFDNNKAITAFHDVLGTNKSNFMYTSDLPKMKRKKYASGPKKTTISIFTWNPPQRNWGEAKDWWNETEIDPTLEGGCYLPIKRFKILKSNDVLSEPSSIKITLTALDKIGAKPDVVYGIKAGFTEKIVNQHTDWIHFQEYAKKKLEAYIKKHKLKEDIANYQGKLNIKKVEGYFAIHKQLCLGNFPAVKGSLFDKVVMAISEAQNLMCDELQNALILGNEIRYEFNNTITLTNLQRKDSIKKRYPLIIPLLETWNFQTTNEDNAKMLAHYISLIENEKGENS